MGKLFRWGEFELCWNEQTQGELRWDPQGADYPLYTN